MRVNKKLKLNKFKFVRIPTNMDFFGRFGTTISGKSSFTGDSDPIPFAQSKIDSIASGAELYEQFAREQENQG